MKKSKTLIIIFLIIISFVTYGCNQNNREITDATKIILSDEVITIDGNPVTDDITNEVYVANDIIYYPEGKDFTFGEAEEHEMHSREDADRHTVLHISEPGCYELSGILSCGQIAVHLGEEAKDDPDSVVTLVFNGADITCEVAPAVIFYNVYECGDKNADTASHKIDTTKAGANIIIADGSINNITGSHVAKIYKSIELNEENTQVIDSKKLHKYDGAFYSKMSMNISGGTESTGILNINADNEGLDSELHLTINGGNINITSGNDGINTNEDNVSVTTINGGKLNIFVTGTTGEGDGIDSNGWLVINGGEVMTSACDFSKDAGIDSDMGIYLNGGKIISGGNMLDRIAGGDATFAVFSFNSPIKDGETCYLKDENGNTVYEINLRNSFSQLIVSDENMKEGVYTLFIGETQLCHSSTPNNKNTGNGKFPQNGEIPEFDPEWKPAEDATGGNFYRPEEDRPERPDRNQVPGNMPEFMPDEGTEPPQMDSGRNPFGNNSDATEQSVEFTIKKGGNYFSNIAEYN